MDDRIRELERRVSTEGWTGELQGEWVRLMDRINPEGPVRKGFKKPRHKHTIYFASDGSPFGARWPHLNAPVARECFEFNDILKFKEFRKMSKARTCMVFDSVKYGTEVEMPAKLADKVIPLMSYGLIKGRFCWTGYYDKSAVEIVEAL